MTQREIARLAGFAVLAGTYVICAAGGPLSALGPLVADIRKVPGFALATMDPANERETRRILAEIAGRRAVQPDRPALAALATSAGGDIRRAIGALTSYLLASDLGAAGGAPVSTSRRGSRAN